MAENEKKQNGFVRFCKRVVKYLRDTKAEVKKIVWPTPRSVFKNTGIVIVVVTIVCLFVFGLDTLFMNLLGLFMNVSG